MKKILILALLGVLSQSIHANNWVKVADDHIATTYIDPSSITINRFQSGGNYVTAQQLNSFHRPQDAGNGRTFWVTKSFEYFDCRAYKNTFDNIIAYDNQGNFVGSERYSVSTYSSANWERYAPNSSGSSKINYVCIQARQ